jgi:hypothetical protein
LWISTNLCKALVHNLSPREKSLDINPGCKRR